MRSITLLLLFLLIGTASLHAKYKITKAANPNFCTSYPSGYSSINFALSETSRNGTQGFKAGQTNATFILGFSNAAFQFKPGIGTVTATGTDVTIVSYSITSSSITVTINTGSSNTELNTINFNNIQVLANNAATGYIKRTGGTLKIDNKTGNPFNASFCDLTAGTPMAYSSASATQSVTSSVFSGTVDNQVIGIQVVITGTCSNSTATAFNLNTTGSTAPATDITSARLYYTGNTNLFSTATLFGSASNPSGSYAITGSQLLNLGAGTYYFWLTYNIATTAVSGDVTDAQLVSSVISGSTFTTASGNPGGSRTISTNNFYSIATGNWSNTAIWSRTSGGAACGCAPTGGTGFVYVNHAVAVDNNYTVDNVAVQNSGNLTNAAGKILTVNNTLSTSGTGLFSATAAWILNNLSTAGTGVSASSSALTLTGSLNVGTGSSYQMTGGAALTVNGNITVDGTLALGTSNVSNSNAAGTIINGTGSITGSGIITLGVNKTIPTGSNLTIAPVININNSITVTNNATVNMVNSVTGGGVNATWVNGSNAVLNVGGAATALLATGVLSAAAVPNTVNYNGSGNQTIKVPSSTYYNLYLASSSTGVKSLAGAIIVDNDIQLSTGAQLNAAANSITINGNWINNSTNATPLISTGTVSFNDVDTISGSAVTSFNAIAITTSGFLISNNLAGKVVVSGNWANDGDFDHNSGDIIFNGTSTISGASVTDFNTVIINSTKTLTLPASETDFDGDLTVNGTLNHNNGLVMCTGNSVAQNINGATSALTLYQLEVNNGTGSVLLSRPITVSNLLTLTAGNLVLGSNNLTLAATVPAVAGSPFSATNMIVASGAGSVIKNGTSAASASYTFPVGDNTGTSEYSPVTLTFTSGTYTSGSASVRVVNAKHPNNTSTTNFINRYWTVSTTGYTVTNAAVAATYTDADITGGEANMLMNQWTGSNPWVTFSSASLNTATNTLTASSINSFGDFTAMDNAVQWTGNVSTDWATAGNWDNGVVPTSLTNVVIPSGATRMPSIVSSVSCNGLTVNSGATVTNTSAGTLNIAGTFTNNGTYTDNGTTVFNGTAAQQTFSGVTAFNNLTVNNSGGLLLGAAVTVNNTLLLTAGTLNTNNFNIIVKGNWTNNVSTTAFTAGSATVTFSGSTAQLINGTASTTFNNFTVANIANTVSLNTNISINGNLSVSSGTFDLAAFTANCASAGGTLTIANNATLKIGGTNTYPANYTTSTLVVASTVEYSGVNQTIANQLYGNLTVSSSGGTAVKTFPATALTISGNFSSNLGTGTSVTYTAAANITVTGNVSIGASTTFNGSSYSHNISGNWTNNGTFNGNTGTITFSGPGTVVSGAGIQNFNNLTVSASLVSFNLSNINVSGNLATISSGSFTHSAGGTLTMTGSGKTISGAGISLNNLSVSGTVTTAASFTATGNLSVSGNLTASAGTITMSGSAMTISGSGTKNFSTLFATGSISTVADLSVSSGLIVSGTFTASAGTVTFTGTSTLNGTANLFNTTVNGTSLQLSSNAILGISNALTITAGVLNVTSSVPNTVTFNGTAAQNINAITYDNLVLSGASTKTAAGAIIVNRNITIGTGATFAAASYTHSVSGNWTNSGTFNAGTSTVQFVGSSISNLTGTTAFNILTSNTSSATTELILNDNVSAVTVNMINGIISTGSDSITITGTRTGNGYIYGNIKRAHAFTTGVAYAFEGPNNTITFSAVSSVTSVVVSVTKGAVGDFPFGNCMGRAYNITVPSGTYTATLRLHYEDVELNGNPEATMGIWNYDGTQWLPIGKTANSTTANYIEQNNLTNITNRWTCSINPSVVLWNGSVSTNWNTAANWTVYVGSASTPPSSSDIAVLGGLPYTYAPSVSTAVSVKNLVFGSVSVALTMAGGGSLTAGDVQGVWGNNAAHTINVNNQTITVNGGLSLSDGVTAHTIDLNIGTGTVNVNGSISQSGGAAITFNGAGNLNIGGDFNYTNGTFTPGTGTVTYNGINNQEIGAVNYNNLTINNAAALVAIYDPFTINGNLSVVAGELDNYAFTNIYGDVNISPGATVHNNDMLHIGGNWNNTGTFIGTGAHVVFNGSGTQTISATTFNNLEIIKPVGSSAELTGNVVINGDLTITSGTLNIKTFSCDRIIQGGILTLADSATFILGANNAPFYFSAGSLAVSSTVIADGTGPQAIYGDNFGNIIFRNGGLKTLVSPITVSGNLTIESGSSFDAGAQIITLNGNWINNGTFTPSTSTLICAGSSKNISGNSIFNGVTVTGSYTLLNNNTFNGPFEVTNTGSLSSGGAITTTYNGDIKSSGVINATGTTIISCNVVQHISLINAATTVLLRLIVNGSVAPVLNSTSAAQFGFITINNTAGINPNVGWTILYDMTVGSGGIFNGGVSAHTVLGSVTNNGTITSSGILNFLPSSAATINLGTNFSSTGRVIFGGAGAMTIAGTPLSFHNVQIANTNIAGVAPVSDWVMTNNFKVNAGAILNAGNHNYFVGGDLSNNGTINSGTSTFILDSAIAQDVYSLSPFNNLTISKAAGFTSLSSNVTVNGALNFVSGIIQTGSDTLIQPSTGTITGAAQNTGWVNGRLQKYMPAGITSKTFEIGDESSYTPASIAFSNITSAGSLTASTTATDHPNIATSNINASKSLNRYFTLTNNGIAFTDYTATFNFKASDVDAGASTTLFDIAAYNGTNWSWPPATARNATSIQATPVTTFGDFAIGQICNRSTGISYTASPYCTNAGTANVTLTGTSGGIFSADTNLSINAATGAIDLISSTPGTYTVSYTIPAAGDCSQFVTSTSVTVGTANTWTGAVNINWNNTGNWSCGGIPVATADITIPSGLSVYPVITSTIPVHDLNISNGASLTVTGGTLQIGGAINNAGTLDVSAGTVQMNGGTAQTIPAGSFVNNNILNLVIGNNVTLAGQQNITGSLSFSSNNTTLTTGGYLTLKSGPAGTAQFADITKGGTISGNSIAGNVTIERYISAGRAWRLLSAPVCSCAAPTINAAWQEGATSGNPNPGFGTHITGGTTGNGFDQGVNNNVGIKYYNSATNTFTGIPPTPGTNTSITTYPGYFLFVRGDRSTNLSLGVNAALTSTTLRVKGQVLTGNVALSINALNYTLAGNPYPAAIDFHTLTKNNVNDKIYLWDPKMGATGGYAVLIWDGSNAYDATTSVSPVSRYIPSGEAFFVESLDGVNPGTLTFKETDKNVSGSDQLFRPVYGNEKMRVNLFAINTDGSASFADGVLTTYNDNNSNSVDRNDAAKILNQSENLCISRDNKNLAIERRKTIDGNDTTFLNLYSLKKQNYLLQITVESMENSGLYAVVKDNYAATTNNTMVNMGGITNVTFTVNSDPASYAINRFSIVFAKQIALPVTFTGIKASRVQKNILVEWTTTNELNTKGYEVQSSVTGSNFTTVAVVNKNPARSTYTWLDENAAQGWHYYRIKLLGIDGNENYSPVVKVSIDKSAVAVGISVNGNSISNNKVVLQFNNVPKGNYRMQLFSMDARLLKQVDISHAGGNATHDFLTGTELPGGKYQVSVTGKSETYSIGVIKE